MSGFNEYNDRPFKIQDEGQTITIRFDRTSDTTGRVSWNIPTNLSDCNSDNTAYNGIVVTLDTTATNISKSPINGEIYTSDPTGDFNLHAGDKLGSSLVVGAFYNDKTTTFFDINGLKPNTPYYISGFAVDQVFRYHISGVHAYSLDWGNEPESDTAATQSAIFNNSVIASDNTGLLTGIDYRFNITLDGVLYTITIDGTNAQTYVDLINELNKQFALMINPLQSPTAPNTGSYYWDDENQQLFQWNGAEHVELEVLIEGFEPHTPVIGDYWFKPDTTELFEFDGTNWILNPFIIYHKDPTKPDCDDYWFDGTQGFNWSGDVWCEVVTLVQTLDPSLPPIIECGTFWFDEENKILYKRDCESNSSCTEWTATEAIYFEQDPNALSTGTFWFDETNQKLFEFDGAIFNEQTQLIISDDEPTTPVANGFWYKPSSEELFQRNGANTDWVVLEVLVWPDDPTNRESCDLWWNSVTDELFIFDTQINDWVLVSNFIISTVDPSLAPNIAICSLWFNTDDELLYKWDGMKWNLVTFINLSTDPTQPNIDDVWFNTELKQWFEWDGTDWVEFNPVDSTTDPSLPTIGDYWYNTTTNQLNQWNGTAWIPLLFSLVPLTPITDSLWFDSINDILYRWDGVEYIPDTLLVSAALLPDCIIFTTSNAGSDASILLEELDLSLFDTLIPDVTLQSPIDGSDAVSNIPTYVEIGVGTDGSQDERKDIIQYVRLKLGHPVVEVELTNQQLENIITDTFEILRSRSSLTTHRGFFFLDVEPHVQQYSLTSKKIGYNKIVEVIGAYRTTALSGGFYGSNGAYDQLLVQQLYNTQEFDLTTFHLTHEYIEQLEALFATRLTFNFYEHSRQLNIYDSFIRKERILLETSNERTDQEMFQDRFLRPWIEQVALALAKLNLAQIRGKYSTLPGAGGGVTFNASDLQIQGQEEMLDAYQQLDDYIAERPELYGIGSQFIIG